MDDRQYDSLPRHCFCHYTKAEMLPWMKKRYLHRVPTVELLDSTADPRGREIITIVGLLDVDDATLLKMLGNTGLPDHHILHCCENAKKVLLELYEAEK